MTGAVKDVWDKPIANASVTIEGITELVTTDAKGEFTMPVLAGKKRLKAGAEGHVFVQETFVFPEGEESKVETPKVELVLYPEPETEGLFLVHSSEYKKLDGQTIDTTGTELQAYTGIEDPGKVSVKPKQRQRFVYRVALSPSEIARVGLELHRLEFVKDTTVTSAMGETNVKVNRFVAKEEVEFDLKELATEHHYLIITRGKLSDGFYAFHSEGLLTSGDVDGLDKTPEELRKAYPFEVK